VSSPRPRAPRPWDNLQLAVLVHVLLAYLGQVLHALVLVASGLGSDLVRFNELRQLERTLSQVLEGGELPGALDVEVVWAGPAGG
jgi:hypothetical protein